MLFRKTSEQEARLLVLIGFAVLLTVAVVAALILIDPFGRGADRRTALTLDTPFVGPGVVDGTPVLMHGQSVGEVTAVHSRPEGGVRMNLRLEPKPIAGLTDTVGVDFRPSNYFGVTGVNLIQGAPGGNALQNGMHLSVVPRGNYTMQALLSRMGDLTGGVITPQLVSVLERATRYVDGLNPVLETLLLVANSVTKVQTVSAGQFVRNAAGITVAAPGFVDAMTDLANRLNRNGIDGDDQFFQERFLATVQLASTGMFGAIGQLLSSHVRELLPATQAVQALTGAVPRIAQSENIAEALPELRTRFERMYEGGDDQRALQVRIVLDGLPGVAAPLDAMGMPPR